MTRIYLDMVSSEPPQHRGKDKAAPPWRPHGVRIAAAVEHDTGRTIEAVLIGFVTPAASWRMDDHWIARYRGVLDSSTPGAAPASIIAGAPWLLDTAATFVGHNAPFHRDVLDGLIADAGGPPGQRDWFCTMREATDICRIPPGKSGGSKPPNIREAYRFFTAAELVPAGELPAREAALQQLNAIRTVYWGIRRWGIPDLIPMPDGP